ncbi:DUF1854 domain-containing protein [Ramlibacter sp. H39-3-26]|uniref:cyanophycin metabolism-associated DUF1854 family protein n=1 Tax=Curvibacter soli TaxID=3031331 RepID=UPI0023D9C7D9|nr:DUF1854 domain-containing protein [Ramlibacter sp. H39-3-26]MDF1485935.1 DUF1854 domain-containing protein [Ramlibacter sp. H39-3-26]
MTARQPDTAAPPALDIALERTPFGRLDLTLADGTRHAGVVPVRAFPLAAPDEGLSFVGPAGHEVLWVARLARLPAPARALVEQELALREFMPTITRIAGVSGFSTPSTWRVETDRGPTEFVLKAEEDIRRLPQGRLLIAGAQGVHYLIADARALDRPSRKLLGRFL